jgi:hypothetical protein
MREPRELITAFLKQSLHGTRQTSVAERGKTHRVRGGRIPCRPTPAVEAVDQTLASPRRVC